MPRYEHPVLVEGSTYAGIWLECAPQEGQVYGTLQKYVATPAGQPTPLETARANHMAFFAQQKEDGQLPASIKLADKVGTSAGYGQIQMVVPIAATAWDIFQLTHDQELLETAYKSCSSWDAWLRQYRDTRKTGLVRRLLHLRHRHGQLPALERRPQPVPRRRRPHVPSRSRRAAPLPRPLRHRLRRPHRPRRHGRTHSASATTKPVGSPTPSTSAS